MDLPPIWRTWAPFSSRTVTLDSFKPLEKLHHPLSSIILKQWDCVSFGVCVFSLHLSCGLMVSVPSDTNLGWSAAALCNSSRGTKVSSGIVWFERCRLSKEVCGLFAVTLSLQCWLPLPSLSHCQAKRPHTLGQIAFPLPELTSFPSARGVWVVLQSILLLDAVWV